MAPPVKFNATAPATSAPGASAVSANFGKLNKQLAKQKAAKSAGKAKQVDKYGRTKTGIKAPQGGFIYKGE